MGKLTKAAIGVFFISVAAKVLGLAKEVLLAYKFGTSYIVDAYTIAISFPSIVFAVFASGIAESYIPAASGIKDGKERNYFTSNIITITTIISIIIMIISMAFSSEIVGILAPGFSGESFELAKKLLYIVVTMLPVMVVYNIYNGQLLYDERFIFTNFVNSLVLNVLILISIVISSEKNPQMLGVGYVISYFVVLIMYISYSHRNTSYRYSFCCKPNDKNFSTLLNMAIPMGISLIAVQLNSLIDKALASSLGGGIIAALGYANKIQLLFYSLVTSVVMSICFPRISMHFSNKEYEKGKHYIEKAFLIATYAGIPVTAVLILFSTPVTQLLFERGNFSSNSTIVTAECLLFYAVGMVFYSYREIFSRVLVANRNQRKVLKNTIIVVLLNISLNISLIGVLKHVGLALATSIAGIVASGLMYLDLKQEGLQFIDKEVILEIIKILFATLISSLGSYSLFRFVGDTIEGELSLILACIVFGLFYLSCSLLLNIKIVRWAIKTVIKR